MNDEDKPAYRRGLVVIIAVGTAVICMALPFLTSFLAMELLYAALMVFSLSSIVVLGISYSYATLLTCRDFRIESTIMLALVTTMCCVTAGLMHLFSLLPHTVTSAAAMWCATWILVVGASGMMLPWILPRKKHGAGQISLAAILFTTAVCAILFTLFTMIRLE